MSKSASTDYDITIVGAGMVGASLACALAGCCPDMRILVLEASPVVRDESPYQPGYDVRSTALSAGSVDSLEMLGLWPALALQATAIRNIHVSDQGRFGATRLHAEDYRVPALGYVVENRWLGRVFNTALLDSANISLLDRCQVEGVVFSEGRAELACQVDGEAREISTRLVVLAEGGRSGLAEKLGIHRQKQDYEQTAIISNVSFSLPHGQVAYERFTEQGPLALLPLQDYEGEHRAALVWTHAGDAANSLMEADDTQFLEKLQEAFGYRLGRFTRVGERLAFPLSLVEAEEQYRPGLVLLGNAAHALHPVAGQGFNLALRVGMMLAGTLRQAWQEGEPPGSAATLQSFACAVRRDQEYTIGFSDQLVRLFASGNPLGRLGRQLGLLSVERLPTLKSALARQAMGMKEPRIRLTG